MGDSGACPEPCCQAPREHDRRRYPTIEVVKHRANLMLHLHRKCVSADRDAVELKVADLRAATSFGPDDRQVSRGTIWRHLNWLADHGWLHWADRRSLRHRQGVTSLIAPNYGKLIGGIEVRHWIMFGEHYVRLEQPPQPTTPTHCRGCLCGLNDVQIQHVLRKRYGFRITKIR